MDSEEYTQSVLFPQESSPIPEESSAERFNKQILEVSKKIETIMKEHGISPLQGEYPDADDVYVYTFRCNSTPECDEIEVCLSTRNKIGQYVARQHPDDKKLPVRAAIRFKKNWTDSTTDVRMELIWLADGIHETVSKSTRKTSDKTPHPNPIPLTKAAQFSDLPEDICAKVEAAFNYPRNNSTTTMSPEHSYPTAVNTRPAN